MYRKNFMKFLCLVLTLLTLIGQLPMFQVVAAGQEPGEAVLFEDDFENGFSYWNTSINDNKAEWGIINEGGSNQFGNTSMQDLSAAVVNVDGAADWTDYSFEADVTVRNSNAGKVELSARYYSNNHRYYFSLRAINGNTATARLELKKNNQNYTLAEQTGIIFEYNQKYHIKGVIKGTHLEMYIDGQLILSADDTNPNPIEKGPACLNTYRVDALFDNVKVIDLSVEPEVTDAILSDLVIATDEELQNEIEYSVSDNVYTATVDNEVEEVFIQPVVSGSENATLTLNGEEIQSGAVIPLSLETGENEFELIVSEEGKISRDYTIIITRNAEEEPPISTWEPTPEQNAILDQYNVYFGATHAHTEASAAHGNKWAQGEEHTNNSAELHFQEAIKLGLDFYCLTDHSQYYNTFTDEKWAEQLAMAEQYTVEGEFVGIRGYEFSENDNGLYGSGKSGGHMNVFNTAERLNADLKDVNYSLLYNTLYQEHQTNPNALAGFNHPGNVDFADYGFLTKGSRDVITTIELINGVNPKVTVDGKEKIIGGDYYSSFIKANDRGWRVSPRAGFDGHVLQAIAKLTYRCGVLAANLTKDDLFADAFKNRRTYASYDENLEIKYTVNDQWMGSVLQDPGDEFRFNIYVHDPDTDEPDEVITKIEIRKNGGALVTAKEFNSHTVHWTQVVRDSEATYFFLRIWTAENMQYKKDRHTAVVAPVWIQRGEDTLPDGPPEIVPDPPHKVNPTPFPENLPYTPKPNQGLPIIGHKVGNEQSNNPAVNSYDGIETTRWSNDGSSLSTAWIQYELDQSYDINYIAIFFLNNTVNWYPIRIEVGDDPANMTTFFEGSTTMLEGYEIFEPTGDVTGPVKGKYVKITLTGPNGRGTRYISIHEIEIMETYTPPAPVTPLELSGLIAATDPGFENTYNAVIEDDKATIQLSGAYSQVYFKPMVDTEEAYTILIDGNEIGESGISDPFELAAGENRFTLEIVQEGFSNREYTVIVAKDSAVTVEIDVDEVVTVRERNDVGLCLSWVTDSDEYEREYYMEDVIKMNNIGTIRWPMGTLAMKYIWNTKDENGNYHYPIKPRYLDQNDLQNRLSWVMGDEPGQIKNEMDFDEFLDLVAATGATAVIDVNGHGDLVSGNDITYQELLDAAEEQVRYAKERGFTGLYWEIGNEIESVFNNREKIDQYIARYHEFYDRMIAVDPTAKIGPGLYLAAQKDNSQMPVMEALRDKMAFIVTHQYGAHGFSADEQNYQGYVYNNDPNKHPIRKIHLISSYIDELADKYGEEYRNKYEILVSEYSSYLPSQWKDYKDAVIYKGLHNFEILAEMMNHPRVGPTHFWITRTPWVNSLQEAMTTKVDHNALKWDGSVNALGMSLNILATNMHETWVKAETLDDFKVKSYASFNPETKDLTIFLLNRQNNSVNADVTLSNYEAASYDISAYVYEGKNGLYYDTEFRYEEIEAPRVVAGNKLSVTLNPASITVIKMKPEDKLFVISEASVDKNAGISVNATVYPVEGFAGGKAAVAFKLMKGDTVIGVFSSEQEINESMRFNVQFHGYSGDEYKVKIYVWDRLDSSMDSIGVNIAEPVEVE